MKTQYQLPVVSFGPLHLLEGSRSKIMKIVCAIAAVKTLMFAFLGSDVNPYAMSMFFMSGVFVFAFILTHFFNKLVFTEYMVTIVSTVWIVYMAVAFGSILGFQHYLIIALVAWSIFSTKRMLKWTVVVGLILMMAVLSLYQLYHTPWFATPKVADVIFAFNVVTPLVMIAFMCWKYVKDLVTAQNTIEQQKEQLVESNKFKDRVFSIIGHDMRSPFNSAKGLVELLASNMLTEEEKQSVLNELQSNIDVSLQTLDNILGWASQSYYGAIMDSKTKPEQLSVHALVEKNISFFSHLAAQKNILFINSTDPETIVVGDLEQISFVLRNLTSNALKFSIPGRNIVFATKPDNGNLIISVKDEGVGMSKESLESLFQIATRFSKEGTTKEKGSGLGLIFCKEFVENNNGKLWIESVPGKGTTVYLSLPQKARPGILYSGHSIKKI